MDFEGWKAKLWKASAIIKSSLKNLFQQTSEREAGQEHHIWTRGKLAEANHSDALH